MRRACRFGVIAILGLTVLSATAAAGGTPDVCRGIKACVAVEGPWVVVREGVESHFLLSCPKRGIVAGIAAVATTTEVRLDFDGRLGSPVSPGVTTSTNAYFRAILVRGRTAAFQPWLGCIAVGGGRSTVSARVAPGAPLAARARTVWLRAGEKRSASLGCSAGERLVGGWHAIAFYAREPPRPHDLSLVRAVLVTSGRQVAVTAVASESLRKDAHALVQVGAFCAP